nr:type II toxin-antitoxin system RelE/ParE family toxin [Candidatus Sigynarchaeota archaeon]
MVEVKWSPQAVEDFKGILEYIGKDSSLYAASFAEKILVAVESLSSNAERGRIVPEKKDPMIREIFLKKYRIIYRITADIVEIVTIIHGSRSNFKI